MHLIELLQLQCDVLQCEITSTQCVQYMCSVTDRHVLSY